MDDNVKSLQNHYIKIVTLISQACPEVGIH